MVSFYRYKKARVVGPKNGNGKKTTALYSIIIHPTTFVRFAKKPTIFGNLYLCRKVTKLKSESGAVKDHHSTPSSKVKYSQKFCEKWLSIFSPWLSRCEDDSNKPFCRACQCRLDCNRCHLQRHERTSKHSRNLEILVNKGEGAARQNLSIRQERSKYYQQRKKVSSSVGSQEDSEMGMEDYIDE